MIFRLLIRSVRDLAGTGLKCRPRAHVWRPWAIVHIVWYHTVPHNSYISRRIVVDGTISARHPIFTWTAKAQKRQNLGRRPGKVPHRLVMVTAKDLEVSIPNWAQTLQTSSRSQKILKVEVFLVIFVTVLWQTLIVLLFMKVPWSRNALRVR